MYRVDPANRAFFRFIALGNVESNDNTLASPKHATTVVVLTGSTEAVLIMGPGENSFFPPPNHVCIYNTNGALEDRPHSLLALDTENMAKSAKTLYESYV